MSAPSSSGKQQFRAPVTALIITLILAVAAPSLAFVALLLFQSDNVSRRNMETRAETGVAAVSQTLDRELRSMVTNLAVFASSGWIETQEYERLHAKATAALDKTQTYLTAIDGDLNQILNTRRPWGTPLPPVQYPDSMREAIRTGQPTVSNVVFGQISQQEVFAVTLPIISGEARAKALILSRSAESLGPIFQESLPPPGWTYAILDKTGKLVSGNAPASGPADLLGQLCAADTPELHERKVDEVTFSAAARTLAPWGWRACVWTSSGQADPTALQRWRTFTIVTLVIVVVTILAGAALGQALAGAIRRAATVGRALDAGGDVPETRSIVREVDDVLGTLTRAARRRLQHEQDQAVLLKETAHRAKNQIAIATALARLSARSAQNMDQLRDDIIARLTALGRSIDMMSATPGGDVSMRELVAAQLEPFAADQPGRLEFDGPDATITPTTAQSLGLVLHEMATNASKYGAWSVPDGKVRIEWVSPPAGGLVINWTERGGPPPPPPQRVGFGSSLIEMMIERTLAGSVARDYKPSGLVATFTLPVRPVV